MKDWIAVLIELSRIEILLGVVTLCARNDSINRTK